MKIITYSDLHLEFGSGWTLPPEVDGDLMILVGDVITLKNYDPLDRLLQRWKKPVALMSNLKWHGAKTVTFTLNF